MVTSPVRVQFMPGGVIFWPFSKSARGVNCGDTVLAWA